MSRMLRLGVVGLLLMLTSLILDVATVGARWVRMGDNEDATGLISACQNAILLGIAEAENGIIPPGYPDGGTWTGRFDWTAHLSFKWTQDNSLKSEKLIWQKNFDLLPNTSPNGIVFSTQYQIELITLDDGRTTRRWNKVNVPITQNATYSNSNLLVAIPYGTDQNTGEIIYKVVDVVSQSTLSASCSEIPNFTDNRVNAYEPWESATAYCEDNMVKVYGIDANANGYFSFAVTQADIDKIGIPNENTLLASAPSAFGGDIRLYKLKDTGELQINAPGLPPKSWKEYVFTWAGCT